MKLFTLRWFTFIFVYCIAWMVINVGVLVAYGSDAAWIAKLLLILGFGILCFAILTAAICSRRMNHWLAADWFD